MYVFTMNYKGNLNDGYHHHNHKPFWSVWGLQAIHSLCLITIITYL